MCPVLLQRQEPLKTNEDNFMILNLLLKLPHSLMENSVIRIHVYETNIKGLTTVGFMFYDGCAIRLDLFAPVLSNWMEQ